MADLAKLVQGVRQGIAATMAMKVEVRTAAEQQLQKLSLEQYPKLVYALGEIIKDQTIPVGDATRQQASVLLQNYVKPRDPRLHETYAKLWTVQSDAFKAQVKQQLVTAMGIAGAEAAKLSRSAASTLAEIAILERSSQPNRWPKFTEQMQHLCHTQEANESTIALRKNTCTLVGQVCDRLSPEHFTQPEVDSLLTSICACMTSRSPEVIGAAMDALTNSLKFIENNFKLKAQRDHIMNEVFVKGVRSTSAHVQEKALQCLVCLCDDYYQHMAAYMQTIMNLTLTIVKSAAVADPVKNQAIEVWNTILEVEMDLDEANNQGFMRKFGLPLVPWLMQATVFRTIEIAEGDDPTPERNARVALQLLAGYLKNVEILKSMMNVVGTLIQKPPDQWAHREMGFVAMGLAMEVAEDPTAAAAIKPYIPPCVAAAMKASKNGSGDKVITQDSALWALDRICVFALNQFPSPDAALGTLQHALSMASTSPNPQIVLRAVGCVRSYFKFFKHCPDDQRLSMVQKYCPPKIHTPVLQTLIKMAVSHKLLLPENNLGGNLFDCIRHVIGLPNLIYTPANVKYINPYFGTLLQVYNHLIGQVVAVLKDQTLSTPLRDLYLIGYCSTIHKTLQAFDHDEYRSAISTTSKTQTETLLQCCFRLQRLSKANAIQSESLLITSSVVSVLGANGQLYYNDIMKNMKAVIDSKVGDSEIVVAIGLICEVYLHGWRAAPEAHHSVMEMLLALMSDKTLSRETKPTILEAITSILAFMKEGFVKYLPRVATILVGAMSVQKPTGDLDEQGQDTADFVDKLRTEILVFFIELLLVKKPEVDAFLLQSLPFQNALGKFCMTVASQATDEHKTMLIDLCQDLANCKGTEQLAKSLGQQPIMQSLSRGY